MGESEYLWGSHDFYGKDRKRKRLGEESVVSSLTLSGQYDKLTSDEENTSYPLKKVNLPVPVGAGKFFCDTIKILQLPLAVDE